MTMEKVYQDTKTEQMVCDLKQFWMDHAKLNKPVNPNLASQEPCLGHYPPDLFYSTEDTQTAYDYPRAAQGGFKAGMREMVRNSEFWVVVVVLVIFYGVLWFGTGRY
jgi:hypothetical protein